MKSKIKKGLKETAKVLSLIFLIFGYIYFWYRKNNNKIIIHDHYYFVVEHENEIDTIEGIFKDHETGCLDLYDSSGYIKSICGDFNYTKIKR